MYVQNKTAFTTKIYQDETIHNFEQVLFIVSIYNTGCTSTGVHGSSTRERFYLQKNGFLVR